jgi:hypothetical protein
MKPDVAQTLKIARRVQSRVDQAERKGLPMTYAVEGSRLGPEVKWALTICSAVLFVDIAQLLWAQRGLQVWSAGCEGLAFWAMVLAGFALFASVVVPFTGALLRRLGWEVITLLPSVLRSSNERKGRPLGHVAEHDLLELALQESSEFLLGWYQYHLEKRQKREAFMQTLGDQVFGCLALAVADWAIARSMAPEHSAITLALGTLGDFAVPVALMVLISACWLLKRTWFAAYVTHWIYYSPLDVTLRTKVHKARERQ